MLRVLTLIFATILVGCAPLPFQETPNLTGFIFDSDSKNSIESAELYYKEYPNVRVKTVRGGKFSFPSITKWHVVVLLPGDRFYHNTLVVGAPGYETQTLPIEIYGDEEKLIYLKPAQ